MDILKNKSHKEYSYTSRYSNFPYYYNTKDHKYIYGTTGQLDSSLSFISVKIQENTTLDALANKYYGRPDYYWIIADFNHISDPFISLSDYFTEIKIPSISALSYKE